MTSPVAVSHPTSSSSKALNAALWVAQVALLALFANAGYLKLFQPIAALAPVVPWVNDVPLALVRFIGLAELAGAIGLVLPALIRIKPQLTVLAAAGLTVIMILAAAFHLVRGEGVGILMTLIFGSVAAFVAWGRFTKAPIAPRA
jgi:putative oxidoreductase